MSLPPPPPYLKSCVRPPCMTCKSPEVGIYKRKQENKKTRKKTKLDQGSDQEKEKVFSFLLGRERVFLIAFLFEFLSYVCIFIHFKFNHVVHFLSHLTICSLSYGFVFFSVFTYTRCFQFQLPF